MKTCWVALDIGSNTVMTLAAVRRGDHLEKEREWFRTTRLGEGLKSRGPLKPAARERTLAALKSQLAAVKEHCGRGHGFAVATSAAREAADGTDFLQACADVVGGQPVCLKGEQEARFAWRGAVADLPHDQPVIHVDVGGGSTEISVGHAGQPCIVAASVPVGAARLAEAYHLLDSADESALAKARQHVAKTVRPTVERGLQALDSGGPGPALRIVASGGTATTFAALKQGMDEYDARRIHGYESCASDVGLTVEHLMRLDRDARARIPGIPEDRAAILPAGLVIVDELLRACDMRRFAVSTRGLRFGIVLALEAGDVDPIWSW